MAMALFKDVEPDVIFRHFIWSVLFIAAVAYFINVDIMPNVEAYKEQMRFTHTTQQTLTQTKAINADAQARVNSFESTNQEQLEVFNEKITESILYKSIPKGFLSISIKKSKEQIITEDQLKKTFYAITGEVSPNNLSLVLNIIPKLHEKHISAILELPLSIQKTQKGNLVFSLNVAITQSIYKR